MLCMLYKMIHKYTTVVYHTCVQEEVTNQTTSMSEFSIAISATELLVLAVNLQKQAMISLQGMSVQKRCNIGSRTPCPRGESAKKQAMISLQGVAVKQV